MTADSTALRPEKRTIAESPIGIFDSGVGGLSVLLEVQALLPKETLLYLADTAHVPYGGRPDEEIRQLTANAVAELYQRGCKAVVVACNTASAFSLTQLREHYGPHFPVIGLVPAVKPAVLATKTGKVGVLATPGTLRGNLLKDVIRQEADPRGVEVLTVVSPELVPFVERGEQESAACQAELRRILQPVVSAGADQLVLGCTHYPFLRPVIEQLFPHQFQCLDSGAAVARQVARVLDQQGLLRVEKASLGQRNQPPIRCLVSGAVPEAQGQIVRLLGQNVPVLALHG